MFVLFHTSELSVIVSKIEKAVGFWGGWCWFGFLVVGLFYFSLLKSSCTENYSLGEQNHEVFIRQVMLNNNHLTKIKKTPQEVYSEFLNSGYFQNSYCRV